MRAKTRVVGRPYPKVDAAAKVAGQTKFADDLFLPRMLHCKILRSKVAHARLVRVDVAKALEGIGEGLARRLLILRGVLAAAAQAVMLLGDVDQLEVEAERSENVGLIARRQRPHGVANSVDVAGRARIARAQPDPFLRLEQLIAFLLDEDLAQHRAEQANVAAERGVGLRTCISSHDHHCAVSCRTWSSRSTAAGSSPRAASRT